MSGQMMEFPESFEKFAEDYGFKDDKKVYTNGIDLIPVYRVKQWLEHDNKLRTIETDTAYECGKHANKWIPVSKRLPEDSGDYLVCGHGKMWICEMLNLYGARGWCNNVINPVVEAWMPLPEPYKAESEVQTNV